MREDTPEGQMVPRGRPPKDKSPPTNNARPEPTVTNESPKQTDKTKQSSSRPSVNKQPVRRSERLSKKNHETSNVGELEFGYTSPPPGFENKHARILTWSASDQQIDELNKMINASYDYK